MLLVFRSRDYIKAQLVLSLPEEVLSVGNTKFSDQCVEGPKFLSLQEYFANPKTMFSTVLELTMTSLKD